MSRQRDHGHDGKIRVSVDPAIYALIPQFLSNRRKDVVAIREAVDRGDFETVRLIGHRMKGDGGSYGLAKIGEIGAAFEQESHRRDSCAVQRSLSDLVAFLETVEVVANEASGQASKEPGTSLDGVP